LGLALAGCQQHGGRRHDQHEPAGQGHRRGDPAGDRSQHEPAGDRRDDEDRDVAQRDCVANREHRVAEADEAEQGPYEDAHDESKDEKPDAECGCEARIELTRCDGAVALARM
jgi:hypothetical protein